MVADSANEKIQIGSLVEVKIGEQPYTYLMADEEEPEMDQVLSAASALGRQLIGRHRAEHFHCRLVDGKIATVEIKQVAKVL